MGLSTADDEEEDEARGAATGVLRVASRRRVGAAARRRVGAAARGRAIDRAVDEADMTTMCEIRFFSATNIASRMIANRACILPVLLCQLTRISFLIQRVTICVTESHTRK